MDHPAFRKAEMTTTLIDQWLEQGRTLAAAPVATDDAWCVAAMARAFASGTSGVPTASPRTASRCAAGHETRAVRVNPDRAGGVAVTLGASTEQARVLSFADGVMRFELHGVQQSAAMALLSGAQVHLAYRGYSFVFEVSPFPSADALQDPRRALSPVAGRSRRYWCSQATASPRASNWCAWKP